MAQFVECILNEGSHENDELITAEKSDAGDENDRNDLKMADFVECVLTDESSESERDDSRLPESSKTFPSDMGKSDLKLGNNDGFMLTEKLESPETSHDKRSRFSYTIKYKKEVLDVLEKNGGNKSLTSRQTGVKRSLIYGWLRQKDEIMKLVSDSDQNVRKRRKVIQDDDVIKNRGKYPELEERLYDWYKNYAKPDGIRVDMQSWQQKALQLFNELYPSEDENAFKASNGWLMRFLRRHRITGHNSGDKPIPDTLPLKLMMYKSDKVMYL